MHNNSNLHRRRISKIQKHSKRKKKLISIVSITSILFLLSSLIIYKVYKKIKCRDLQYAIEYQLTSGSSEARLLRVQHISLIFDDQQKVVVEVSGLDKEKPHSETTIKGTFKKDFLDSWKLESAEKS